MTQAAVKHGTRRHAVIMKNLRMAMPRNLVLNETRRWQHMLVGFKRSSSSPRYSNLLKNSAILPAVTPNLKHRQVIRHCCTSFKVTLDNILSDENKTRCQKHLSAVKPVRDWAHLLRNKVPEGAVLVPLCKINGDPSVLFTLRSSNLKAHRGEVSFPGGKEDSSDRDLVHTALRETQEELGLNPANVDVWGKVPPSPGKNLEILVTPIVAYCGEVNIEDFKHNAEEVESVFACSISQLVDPDKHGYTRFRHSAGGYTLPVFTGAEHRIWGLTAVILHQVLTSLAPGLYNLKIKESPPHQHKR